MYSYSMNCCIIVVVMGIVLSIANRQHCEHSALKGITGKDLGVIGWGLIIAFIVLLGRALASPTIGGQQ